MIKNKNNIIKLAMTFISVMLVYSFEIESPSTSNRKYLFLAISIIALFAIHTNYLKWYRPSTLHINSMFYSSASGSIILLVLLLDKLFFNIFNLEFVFAAYGAYGVILLLGLLFAILNRTQEKLLDSTKLFLFYLINMLVCITIYFILSITVYPVFG